MAQSKAFTDASHALNDLSHALALLESENASLRGAFDGICNENAKLRELCKSMRCALADHDDKVYLSALDDTLVGAGFDLQKLGIEVSE